MTPSATKIAVDVMNAYISGKQIQVAKLGDSTKWQDIYGSMGETPAWNWEQCSYRVAPKPEKPKEYWLVLDYAYDSREIAEKYAGSRHPIIHVRQVIPS